MIEFEEEGIRHVKMFVIITLAYVIFWGPLFVVTLINISLDWKSAKSSVSHEVVSRYFIELQKNNTIFVLFFCRRFLKENVLILGLAPRLLRTRHSQPSPFPPPPPGPQSKSPQDLLLLPQWSRSISTLLSDGIFLIMDYSFDKTVLVFYILGRINR